MVDILSCDILEEMEDGKRSRGVWHIINNHNRAASDAALQIRRYLFMLFVDFDGEYRLDIFTLFSFCGCGRCKIL